MIKPLKWKAELTLLDSDEVAVIHLASLRILDEVGVVMPLGEERYELLESKGAKVDRDTGRVRFSAPTIADALESAPTSYTLYARDPNHNLPLDGRHGYLCLDGTGLKVLDIDTGELRSSCFSDLEDAARVADNLPQVAFLWPCISAQDKPPALQPLYELFALLKNSSKHIQAMTAVNPMTAAGSVAMAAAVVGGRDRLRATPIISNFQCSISPLSYDGDALEAALIFAEAGVPVGFLNMQIGCATAPATLAGNIAMGNAEILAGITFLQCFHPGAPTFYGSCATMMELRTGGVTAGGPEDFALQVASVQMAKYYGLPCNIGTFATGAKQSGWQAGLENALSGAVSQFCHADMMCGAGLTNGATVFSFEQLLMDCEIYDMVRHVAQGITVNADTLALEAITRVGPRNHFMTDPHTRKHLRSIWQPTIIDRTPYDDWKAGGGRTSVERARARAREILKTHHPAPLPNEREVKAILNEYAASNASDA